MTENRLQVVAVPGVEPFARDAASERWIDR
jgi:hypothetical protein